MPDSKGPAFLILAVTSMNGGVGKTTTSAMLALYAIAVAPHSWSMTLISGPASTILHWGIGLRADDLLVRIRWTGDPSGLASGNYSPLLIIRNIPFVVLHVAAIRSDLIRNRRAMSWRILRALQARFNRQIMYPYRHHESSGPTSIEENFPGSPLSLASG